MSYTFFDTPVRTKKGRHSFRFLIRSIHVAQNRTKSTWMVTVNPRKTENKIKTGTPFCVFLTATTNLNISCVLTCCSCASFVFGNAEYEELHASRLCQALTQFIHAHFVRRVSCVFSALLSLAVDYFKCQKSRMGNVQEVLKHLDVLGYVSIYLKGRLKTKLWTSQPQGSNLGQLNKKDAPAWVSNFALQISLQLSQIKEKSHSKARIIDFYYLLSTAVQRVSSQTQGISTLVI